MRPEAILDDLIVRYPHLQCIEEDIYGAFVCLQTCFKNNGSLYCCGNGGSASDALHLVGELMKSFVLDRKIDCQFTESYLYLFPNDSAVLEQLHGALPAYALVENTAFGTAFSNDQSAEMVFAQQVYGYMKPGDVLLGISTSGNSRNIINALKVAKAKQSATIGLLGGDGGEMKQLCDHSIIVPETMTYKVQELHVPIYHTLALMLEESFFGDGPL